MAVGGKDLVDLVFSWSINDVMNTELYKDQVKTIPFVFSSETEYLNSFINPLIEETHADLLASFGTLCHALSSEIESVKRSEEYKSPKDLLYEIELQKGIIENDGDDVKLYEPEVGDIIAITSVIPKCVGDLDRPERSYLIAHVKKVKEKTEHFKVSIQLSKPTLVEEDIDRGKSDITLFAVKLINVTTNVRIWNALNSDPEAANRGILRNILQTDFLDAETCTICCSEQQYAAAYSNVRGRIHSSDLNESQKDAVLSCIRTRECHHQNTVKMIWGPPGTGKTKTVGFLLHLLLRMECRTLTCAPTNTAIVQVTKRVTEKVKDSSEFRKYGLGDIVLFGNRKRMKIDDYDDLYDVFLDHRVDMLQKCLSPKSGWEDSLHAMIGLLKEPEKQYSLYLKSIEGKEIEKFDSNGNADQHDLKLENEDIIRFQENGYDSEKIFKDKNNKKGWRRFLVEALKENMNKNKPKDHMLPLRKEKKSDGKHTEEKLPISPLTFGEFVKKMFGYIKEWLYFFTVNLHTHLPTSVISLEDVKNMFAAVDSLKSFQPLLHDVPNEDLKEAYSRGSCFTRFNVARVNSLFLLESLPSKFSVPYSPNRRLIKEFCLEKACLIFCTTSGSAKLNIVDMLPLELLVIDEAAQLKECESTIPLQLPGIRHAILVGDERQLPSMVKSQISEGVYFGRSLFERLAFLEHKKYLLNVQYRMHLSISLFPNREFYGNQILDGQNVKARSYNRRFLRGKLYNSYSFIDVSHGKEEFDDKRSRKNRVEVAVVSEIVASLHKEFTLTRKKVRVGVISPYKAQVHAIAEKIKEYTSHAQSDFFVSVRTVDGFQGGEEDVIIISTVRCNGIGSVSFLSSRQRGNVALTRARYCLWIVGSGSTLSNSGTFWKKLVADAKERGCFHSALEDKILACAITFALLELNQVSMLCNLDSLLFRESKWKVCFTDAFWGSMTRFKSNTFCKRVFALLEKLSSGWRQQRIGGNHVVHGGISSQFVEYYVVNTQSYLVWTVDILKENSHYIQVLKVWDILPQSDVPELSNRLDVLYGSYSVKKMSRCKYICYDGDSLVPMRWPIDSGYQETDPGKLLSKPVPSSSPMDKPESSSTNARNFVSPTRFSTNSRSAEAYPVQLLSESVGLFSPKDEPETSSSTTNPNLIVSSCVEDDPIELLSKSFALVSLRDKSEVSSTTKRGT